MKYTIDDSRNAMTIEDGSSSREVGLYSPEALQILTGLWVKAGWAAKDSYQFTWAGRPIIQLPHDVMRYQELVWRLQPDVIVETGVAHGGLLALSASLCRIIGKGRVIGIDVEIRAYNRAALDAHPLREHMTLVEGSSTDPAVIRSVFEEANGAGMVLVMLDSNHSKAHVRAEMEAYCRLVSPGSYLIVADGIMQELVDSPGGSPEWRWDNPVEAMREFLAAHPEFVREEPARLFDETRGGSRPTYWPGGYLKRTT